MNSAVLAYRSAWSAASSPYAAWLSLPETTWARTRPPVSWSSVAVAAAKFAGCQYPGRTAMSGSNVVVLTARAVATVKVSGRSQPVPISAPVQPWSSSARACEVRVWGLLWSVVTGSPRWPGVPWLGMYHRNSRLMALPGRAAVSAGEGGRGPLPPSPRTLILDHLDRHNRE